MESYEGQNAIYYSKKELCIYFSCFGLFFPSVDMNRKQKRFIRSSVGEYAGV